jgi:hypothetical protein
MDTAAVRLEQKHVQAEEERRRTEAETQAGLDQVNTKLSSTLHQFSSPFGMRDNLRKE